MTLTQMLSMSATIIRRSASGEEDAYGNETTKPEEIAVLCYIEQKVREEPADQGETSETNWLGMFPADTDLRTSDAVRTDDLGTLELIGDPWPAMNPRTRSVSHLEATMRKTSGAAP